MSDETALLRVELFRGEDGDWWFRAIAENGEQVSRSSEGYENRADAVHAAELAHPGAEIIEVIR